MNILVLDDEVFARQELTYLIRESEELTDVEIFEAEDISSAEKILFRQSIDVIFIDISLSEENGFTLANQLEKLAKPPLIIFATAYDQYAVKAFDSNATDYILKPFEQERIDKALAKVKKVLQLEGKDSGASSESQGVGLLTLTLVDRSIVLKWPDIVSASVDDGELTVTTKTSSYSIKKPLNWFKARVKAKHFLQIHRNTVVNLEMIKEIEPWFNHTLLLIMENGEKFPVGRSYMKDLNSHLTL